MWVQSQVLKKFRRPLYAIEDILLGCKTRKDVLLVARHRILYNYARELHEILRAETGLRLWVCFPFPQNYQAGEISRLKRADGIRTVPYAIARFFRWDLILFPGHGPGFRQDCRRIFTGHGLMAGKTVENSHYVFGYRSLRNQKISYDRIFCASDYVKSGVRELYPRFHDHTRVVGDLFIDQLAAGREKNVALLRARGLDPARKTIMVVSTWGPDSFAEQLGPAFLDKVPSLARQYNLVIAFHLLNFSKASRIRDNWQELLRAVSTRRVCYLEPGENPFGLLAQADLLLTDNSNLGLYFPLLERPVIYYDNPDVEHAPLSLARELRNVAHVINDVSDLETDIRTAFDNFDSSRMRALAMKISSRRGRAAQRYREEIMETLHRAMTPGVN